jgi:hypothetical protein
MSYLSPSIQRFGGALLRLLPWSTWSAELAAVLRTYSVLASSSRIDHAHRAGGRASAVRGGRSVGLSRFISLHSVYDMAKRVGVGARRAEPQSLAGTERGRPGYTRLRPCLGVALATCLAHLLILPTGFVPPEVGNRGTSWTAHRLRHRKSATVVTRAMRWRVSLRSRISDSMLRSTSSLSLNSCTSAAAARDAAEQSSAKQSMMSQRPARLLPMLACCMRSPFATVRMPQPPIRTATPRW